MYKESKFSLPLYGEKGKSGPWCAGFWQYPPTSRELAPCVVYNAVWPRFPPATQTRFLFSFSPFYPHTLVEPLAVISFSSQLIYGVAGGAGGYFYVCKPRAFLLPCLLPVAMEGSEFISFTYHLSTLPGLSRLSRAQPHRSRSSFNSGIAALLWPLALWLGGKESVCSSGDAGDMGSIPGSGRCPGAGNGKALQDSCLKNPTVQRVPQSGARLSIHCFLHPPKWEPGKIE